MKSAIMEKGVREKSQKTGVIVSSTLASVALDKNPAILRHSGSIAHRRMLAESCCFDSVFLN